MPPEARPTAGGAGVTGGTGGAGAGGKAASGASLFAPGYTGGRASAGGQAPAGGGWSGSAGGAVGKGPVRGFPPAPGRPPPLYPPGQFAAWNRAPAPGENGYDPGLSGTLSGPWQAGYPDAADSPQARYADVGYGDTGYSGYSGTGYSGTGYSGTGYSGTGYSGTGYSGTGYSGTGYSGTGYSDAGYSDQGYAATGYADAGSADPGYAALAVSDPAADVTNTQSWVVADDTEAGGAWGDLGAPGGHGPDADALRRGIPAGAALPAGLAGAALAGPALGPFEGAADQVVTGPNQPIGGGPADRSATGPQRAAAGPFDLATPAPFNRSGTGPNQPVTTGPGTGVTGARPGAARGRGHAARGRGSRGRKRSRGRGKLRALLICGVALIVVVGVTYFFFARDRKSTPAADSRASASVRPSPDPSPSSSPLGQWGHIETRALDPVPLTLAELFPASFTSGTTSYVRTVQKAKTHCAGALAGSQLIAAVSHAGCTQAMRASYLSSDHKLMGTIGVLNLATATAAEQAGKVTGSSEFIAQLPAARGPTKNLTKGTGFEAAEVKGHYLVLVWAEFANLRTPRTARQRSELEEFITLLMQKTANVSLATRQVTGSPPT
jgi:hypothetical protein